MTVAFQSVPNYLRDELARQNEHYRSLRKEDLLKIKRRKNESDKRDHLPLVSPRPLIIKRLEHPNRNDCEVRSKLQQR